MSGPVLFNKPTPEVIAEIAVRSPSTGWYPDKEDDKAYVLVS